MKLLALETATEACSAALYLDGEIQEEYALAPRGHARLLLPMVESLLNAADMPLSRLDGIAFGRGPGAFTGLRIAAGVTQGLALGAGLAVAPVSSLAALAQGALRLHGARRVLACLDARMQEVYWGAFTAAETGLMQPAGPETVSPAGEVPLPTGAGWLGAGTGWQRYGAALQARCAGLLAGTEAGLSPRAHDIALLGVGLLAAGQGLAPEQALPVYVRNEVAHKPA